MMKLLISFFNEGVKYDISYSFQVLFGYFRKSIIDVGEI